MLIKLSIIKPPNMVYRFTYDNSIGRHQTLADLSVLVRVSPLLNKKGATAVAPKHENILSKKLKKLTTTTINKVASLAAG